VILFELPLNSITRPFANLCLPALVRAGASALRYPRLELSPLHFNQHRERSAHSGTVRVPFWRRINRALLIRRAYHRKPPLHGYAWSNA